MNAVVSSADVTWLVAHEDCLPVIDAARAHGQISISPSRVIVVGDAASALKVAPAALDSIAGDARDSHDAPIVRDVRITRTVLRSDVLHAVRGEPLDPELQNAPVSALSMFALWPLWGRLGEDGS